VRTIILDGYNVILRSPAFRPDERQDLAMAREKLINLLSWALGGTGQVSFLVVFDGADVAPAQRRTVKSGGSSPVEVRFSKPPLKADDVIRELVEDMAPRMSDLTVVTSDLEVARHARAMGADISIADLFLASAFPAAKDAGGAEGVGEPEKPVSLSKREIEEWAELFKQRQGKGEPGPDET